MTNSNGKYVVGELDEFLVFIAIICFSIYYNVLSFLGSWNGQEKGGEA